MLYKIHNNIFIIGLLAYGIIGAMLINRSLSIMTLASFIAFITQVALTISFSRNEETDYSERVLFIVVLIYTISLGIFFMYISEYFEGDTFMLSKMDAMFYYKESMRAADAGIIEGTKYIAANYDFDDWGALLFDMFIMYLVPEKLFLNAIYFLTGAASAIFLYRIGKTYMPDSYAFLAAMSYATSSFMVFFHCTFLKESIFVFIVILTIYYFQCAITYPSNKYLILVALCIGILFFFRPAIAAFLGVSFGIYYGITQKGTALSLFLYAAAAIATVIIIQIMQRNFQRYSVDGDMGAVLESRSVSGYSSSFNYFVSYFGSFFGPFPTLFSKIAEKPTLLEFYGAGLTYRLFLIIPFWSSIFFIVKKRVIGLVPLVVFILMEMAATGYIYAGLELRKVLLHIPFMYILSFYGLYQLTNDNRLKRWLELPTYAISLGIMFLWNVIK